jgi:hypothetical protein
MAKFYTSNYEDECYQKQHFIEYVKENNFSEIELTEERQIIGSGYFWCTEFDEIGEVGELCGKICKKYIPRNGKNGRCKFSNNVYESTDKKIILKNKNFIANPK